MLKKILVMLGLVVLTTACSSGVRQEKVDLESGAQSSSMVELEQSFELTDKQVKSHRIKTNRPMSSIEDKSLARIFNEWRGTRYRLGGTSKSGIDCSAFTRMALLDAYGIKLPRSTAEQRYLGKKISRSELRQGDLVFFRGNGHVGVYIGNNQFMHSSTSRGVIISSLDENYWVRTYTQSRRVM